MNVLGDTLVDWSALLKVVEYSLAIGIGVTAAASLAILGATRFADLRQDGRLAGAGAFAVVMVLGAAAVVAAVVLGILAMTDKG
jgi:hypothetical protein